MFMQRWKNAEKEVLVSGPGITSSIECIIYFFRVDFRALKDMFLLQAEILIKSGYQDQKRQLIF